MPDPAGLLQAPVRRSTPSKTIQSFGTIGGAIGQDADHRALPGA
jgi:hypothetical protein